MAEARELFRKGKENLKKNWLKAYQYFLEARDSDPSFMPVYSEIADLLYKKGFVKEALSFIEEGMRIKPDDQMLLFAMANLYLSTGKPGPALRYYRRLYERMDNPPPEIYFLMGLCHSLLGHYRKALALVKKAISLIPTSLRPMTFMEGSALKQADMMRLNQPTDISFSLTMKSLIFITSLVWFLRGSIDGRRP